MTFSKMIFIILLGLTIILSPVVSFASTTAVVTVTATVLQGESSISVDTSLVNFGSVSGSVNNRRFIARPAVKVSYFPGTSPWTVRVYTVNPGPKYFPGLIGVTDPSKYIPLRVWCDNYGPIANQPGQPPDEENDYFWKGYDFNGNGPIDSEPITSGPAISEITYQFDINGDGDALDTITPWPTKESTIKYPVSEEPVWLNVRDWHEMNSDPYSWRRLAYSGAELDPDGFLVYFAINVAGVMPQDYRTTTLTFQITNE